ncbi:MAG: hypothetical protein QME75_16075 [Deltaproteobacteria bacterium]|nr:hypothetical protein [Deltaproteobacteria bacterium]
MAKIMKFRLTKKGVYRAAVREMEKMYRLSYGGSDPIIDECSRELFENGQIDEVKWVTWHRYCQNVLADLSENPEND